MAYVCAVIGMRGQGKTTFIKRMLRDKNGNNHPNFIFDYQNEYAEFNPAPFGISRKEFVAQCMQFTDTFCVFQEATGFFKGRLDEETDRLILSARHQRNNYIFCFHSIEAVPPGIMRMLNFVVLFKTADEASAVKRKYNRLLKPFLLLQQKPNYSKLIITLV